MNILDLCKKDIQARRELDDHIGFLVSDRYLSFSSLCESDKSEVVGLLLKALDSLHKWDCIVESSDSDVFMYALTQALMTPCEENKKNLFDVIQKNSIRYYEDSLNELFSEKYNEIERDNCGDIPSFRLSRDHEYINGTDYRR